MYRIFRTDTEVRGLIMGGKASVIYYSPRGQEAIPSALSALLTNEDTITTTYRGMHDTIAKGAPLREVVAEIIGRAGGTSRGKGGIMHLNDPRCGVMATSGIVGGAIPIANGLALRAQMTGSDAVTLTYFGDGATNIGAFHEAMNMAAVWKLPVLFVCQNNEYGEYTPRMESMNVDRISTRADAYGMPGVTVDGNDPDAVYQVGAEAVARARAGDGPTLIEAKTYRFMGHVFGSDTMAYMPKDERKAAVAADPVPAYRVTLLGDGASEDDLKGIEVSVDSEVADAIEFALASPTPDTDDLYTDVYAEVVPA
ncbi:pyruvate dehydrogenase [Rhodococcus sp. RS1C4]|nr:pyruvate dehydrogenase [Rhodococcus sp. RS1C4]